MSHNTEIVSLLYFLFRTLLEWLFAARLLQYCTIEQDIRRNIDRQIENIVLYYMDRYVNLIDNSTQTESYSDNRIEKFLETSASASSDEDSLWDVQS